MQILASERGFLVFTGLKTNICSFDIDINKRNKKNEIKLKTPHLLVSLKAARKEVVLRNNTGVL